MRHDAVGRNALARTDQHDVADAHVVDIDVDGRAVALDARGLRLKTRQRADRLGGAALGARLQKAAEQNQRDDDDRGFVIDIDRAFGKEMRQEGRDHRIEIGAERARRDQRVHVRLAAQQRRNALDEEDEAGAEENDRGAKEGDLADHVMADGRHHPIVKARDDMRAHLQHENGRGEDRGEKEPHLQRLHLFVAARAFAIGGACICFDEARLIAGLRYGAAQALSKAGAHEGANGGALGREIDLRVEHAGHAAQRLFDMRDARGACHAADANLDRFDDRLIAGVGDGFDELREIRRQAPARPRRAPWRD